MIQTTLTKNDKLFLVILFMLSLCTRSVVFQCYLSKNENFWQVDSATYHRVAQGIAEGKGISLPSGQPNFYRLPGYPLFMAFFYKIFGPNTQHFLWAQIILGALIPVLIFFLSLVLFPGSFLLARCASLYSAFHLGLVLYSGFFMTETLFLIFFLLFCITFFSHIHLWFCPKQDLLLADTRWRYTPFVPEPLDQTPSFTQMYDQLYESTEQDKAYSSNGDQVFKELILAGLFLGFASMIRPVGHYLVVLSLIMLILSRDTWRQSCKKALTFFVPWLLVVMPWLVRNYLLLGQVFFHTLPGGHFLYLSAARVAMNVHDMSYQHARERLGAEVAELIHRQEVTLGHQLNEIERCYVHEQIAKKYFTTYPVVTLKIWVTDMLRTCLSLYSAELLYLESGRKEIDYFGGKRSVWSVFERYLFPHVDSVILKLIIWLEILFFLVILIGFFCGLGGLVIGLLTHQADPEVLCSWMKVLPYMALFIVIALAGGYARMRLPLEPFLIILGFFGLGFWRRTGKTCLNLQS